MEKASIIKGRDGQLHLKNFYTSLSVAKKEIWRRRKDEKLRKKVENFIKEFPDFLADDPKAVLARQIATPNFELYRFLSESKKTGLEQVCAEYLDDKFSSGNKIKYHLCKMYFYDGKGKNGGGRINVKTIVNFNKIEHKELKNIETYWGENLVNFHHRILNDATGLDLSNKIKDASCWVNKISGQAKDYYPQFLALFVCNGILFENFLIKGDKEEANLTAKIVIPSFNKIVKYFGVKPLITNLLPLNDATDSTWFYYPKPFEKIAIKKY